MSRRSGAQREVDALSLALAIVLATLTAQLHDDMSLLVEAQGEDFSNRKH